MNLEKEYMKDLDFFKKPKEKSNLIQHFIRNKDNLINFLLTTTMLGLMFGNSHSLGDLMADISYFLGIIFGIKFALNCKDSTPNWERNKINKGFYYFMFSTIFILAPSFLSSAGGATIFSSEETKKIINNLEHPKPGSLEVLPRIL